MKIGITEYGDAGRDLRWFSKMHSVDGAVLITKTITKTFGETLLTVQKPVILHATCTGWGGSYMEPHVYEYSDTLTAVQRLIQRGFPRERIVIRIDPIIPIDEGLERCRKVLEGVEKIFGCDTRIRVSIMDEYPHVRARIGRSLYNNCFTAPEHMMKAAAAVLNNFAFTYETCAEDRFVGMLKKGVVRGCISRMDLELMGISADGYMTENPQHRSGCHCLSCKTELLRPDAIGVKVNPCPNGCLYCFWKR